MKIIDYFSKNPKSNPLVVVISLVFDFFIKLFIYQSLSDKSDRSIASALKVNPYFVKDYSLAARNYSMKSISSKISILLCFKRLVAPPEIVIPSLIRFPKIRDSSNSASLKNLIIFLTLVERKFLL